MAPPRKTAAIKVNGEKTLRRQEAARKLVEQMTNDAGETCAGNARDPSILEMAHSAVNGERMENYGDQLTNFTNIGDLWSVLLREKLIAPITPQEVAMMQIALKLARLTKTGGMHRDSIVDVAGYAECLDQVNKG